MKRIVGLLCLFVGSAILAQTPITVKSSATEDALVQMAKQNVDTQKVVNDILQQARTVLDQKNKPIQEEIKKRSEKWQAKIDADTKELRAQIDTNNREAEADFQKKAGSMLSQITPQKTFETLEEIVKKEQNLPQDAIFDLQKQVWTIPSKPNPEPPKATEPAKK